MIRSVLRRAAEQFSRGRVLRRRLPEAFGRLPIYVTPEAALALWRRDLGRVDAVLLQAANELVGPGLVVWDVGANVGLFAFAAAARAGLGGLVVAIEPDPALSHLLIRSAVANNTVRVSVITAAIGRTEMVLPFCIADRGRAANHLKGGGSSQAGGTRYCLDTVVLSLDFLGRYSPPPDLIKIDVETFEGDVLAGGMRVLNEHRPIVICEVAHSNRVVVDDVLRPMDYVYFDLEDQTRPRLPVSSPTWNTLAIPRSRLPVEGVACL